MGTLSFGVRVISIILFFFFCFLTYISRKLFICGDIHGKLKTLVWKLVEQKKITDADVIIVGDIGIGFGRPKSFEVQYKSVERRLERSNIKLWCIRGNHDDPSFFNGSIKYPFLELLPDHITVEIGDYKVYPIGGATSTDREDRLKAMKHSKHASYWEGEKPERKGENFNYPPKVDIIVSHESPLSFKPIPERPDFINPDLWEEILEDRRYLEEVKTIIRSGYWFFGHYHRSFEGENGTMIYRGLGELEIFEVPGKIELP